MDSKQFMERFPEVMALVDRVGPRGALPTRRP